jgi:toxin secretion/phage lysis holin
MICDYLPSQISAICGISISSILWLVGGVDISLTWLFVFCVIDYITGTCSAFRQGQWTSKVGGKGIVKKLLIFLFVVLAHGIDEVCRIDYIRQAVIIAYIINESGSILENIETLGYGKVIPPILRHGLKLLKMKNESILDQNSDLSHNINQK